MFAHLCTPPNEDQAVTRLNNRNCFCGLHGGRDRPRTCDLLRVKQVGWPKLLTIQGAFCRFGRPKRPRRRLNHLYDTLNLDFV
jgi:hypothetical protein